MSIMKQLKLLGVARSSYYYRDKPKSDFNLQLTRIIDEIYTESPEYGSRKIRDVIRRENKNIKGLNKVNRKRIQRLMRIMGIEAIYPKRNLSKPV